MKPNIRLRNEQNPTGEMVYHDCSETQNWGNLCPESNTDEENINIEIVTTTVKVLVPDNENYL